MANKNLPVVVVGGGLAGLACSMRLAEAGTPVKLISICPVKRSHSVCAQGGINAAKNTKGEGDSPEVHSLDTLRGGDFLATQPLVQDMCEAGPVIIDLMDRLGVAFNRTDEGNLDFRRFGGTLYNRTAFSGASTGQQLLYALDEQVRRHEVTGLVEKFEGYEFLHIIKDNEERCRGAVIINLENLEIIALPAAAVVLATGGPGLIFGRTTNSVINHGSAAGSVYLDGAIYANPEFVQIHPTAIAGNDKCRLISESVRGEGGRIWVPKDKNDKRMGEAIPESERWYVFEDRYPKYGNLIPRDIASRELHDVAFNLGWRIHGVPAAYLDITHLPADTQDKLASVLEIYEKFMGQDPRKVPMRIFPAIHYSMGGLWTDFATKENGKLDADHERNQMTNIKGLYAVGEVDYQYHGSNRLGANSLLSCIYGGLLTAKSVPLYAEAHPDVPEKGDQVVQRSLQRAKDEIEGLKKMDGPENVFVLHEELGELMNKNVTVTRHNAILKETEEELVKMLNRQEKAGIVDTNLVWNTGLLYARQLKIMTQMARAITRGALLRDESRGAHYKPDFDNPMPEPENRKPGNPDYERYYSAWEKREKKWRKSTLAKHDGGEPKISYEKIKTDLYEAAPRLY